MIYVFQPSDSCFSITSLRKPTEFVLRVVFDLTPFCSCSLFVNSSHFKWRMPPLVAIVAYLSLRLFEGSKSPSKLTPEYFLPIVVNRASLSGDGVRVGLVSSSAFSIFFACPSSYKDLLQNADGKAWAYAYTSYHPRLRRAAVPKCPS